MSRIDYKPWKVTIVESDSYRGQEVLDKIYFDNEQEARDYARPINANLTAKVTPECYIFAEVSPC